MRSYLRWWVGGWLLLLALAAQAQTGDSKTFDRGLLWRIDKPGQPASYLFGTIHTWNAGLVDVLARATPYLKSANAVATEMVLDEANAAQIARSMVLKSGQTLPGLLGAEDYRRLLALLEPRGMDDGMVRALKPWAALTLLVTPTAEGGLPMDMQLTAMAKRLGKPIVGLESAREQIDIFDQMAVPDQLLMLRATLLQGDMLGRYLENLYDLYWAEDLAGLARMTIDEWPVEPQARAINLQLMERLFYARNRTMATRLLPMMRGKSLFIAVGALHLAGERGIPALLAAKGYRVVPVE